MEVSSRLLTGVPGLEEVVNLVVLVLVVGRGFAQHVGCGEPLPVDAVVTAEVDHQVGPAGLDGLRGLVTDSEHSGVYGGLCTWACMQAHRHTYACTYKYTTYRGKKKVKITYFSDTSTK